MPCCPGDEERHDENDARARHGEARKRVECCERRFRPPAPYHNGTQRDRGSVDRAGEKRSFEELVDFITTRRERNPGLHVYHYNHYEPTSIDHLTEWAKAGGRWR